MTRPWHICVLIPARNEEELLPRCLTSVLHARGRLPAKVTCDIVVAVDTSTDRTACIAQSMLSGYGTVVIVDAGIVGSARAFAATIALDRYRGPLPLCWFAHTDADCVVPEDWLLKQLVLAEEGIEAIAGTVSIDSFRDHSAEVEQRFHSSYLIQADGRHSHVHGANLGIRADVYRRAGGWAQLATAEDHDLWNRLHVAGCTQVSTSTLQVITSGRRVGRAPHGFAEALSAHNEGVA
jgi:cellulose synthase/poly-beta-1,6-N-acetylglucosamine synthase-like glycosyltransferase